MRRTLCLLVGLVCLTLSARAADPPQFEFKDGDRVVLIGDTLIERDQKYGYLETILTLQNPDKTITFRNLGWSGDTVAGLSRARFGPPSEGEQHLKDHVLALKPTVVIVGYGMADSFDGEAGLPRFVAGLNGLLDVLAATKARILLLTPIAHEDLGPPWPDPDAHNRASQRYTEVIMEAARTRGYPCVSLFHKTLLWKRPQKPENQYPRTDDGIHLTEGGYWVIANEIDYDLVGGMAVEDWMVELDRDGRVKDTTQASVSNVKVTPGGLRFESRGTKLPLPGRPSALRGPAGPIPPPRPASHGTGAGFYALKIDGIPAASAPAERWSKGVIFTRGPEFDQVEKLRQTINDKNLLYFHRWRPENETYLFGFRKHEQGNNAREIPLFDPLVEAKEKEIARLRKPVKHTYELIRESKATE